MPKFAANLTMLFNELPFMQRFEAAAKAGFKAVEYLFPYAYDKANRVEVESARGTVRLAPTKKSRLSSSPGMRRACRSDPISSPAAPATMSTSAESLSAPAARSTSSRTTHSPAGAARTR